VAHALPALVTTCLLAVANLQRDRHRSSVDAVVHNPVDSRWKDVGYALFQSAGGCFCCCFASLFRCIKNRLPSPGLPTMLGVHQALEHKI
jgi:hypothetical protein